MTDTLTPAVPAGWYDDPSDASAMRWWSGAEWTTYTEPKQAPVVAPVVAPAAAPAPEPSQQLNGSPQTAGIWLLSFLPLMTLSLSLLSSLLVLLTAVPALSYTGVPFSIGLVILFAVLDSRALQRRGYVPTSPLWLLLAPPLAYLIVRGRSVRKQGGLAWPSELVYLVSVGLLVAASIALAGGPLATGPVANPSAGTDPAQTYEGETYFAGTVDDQVVPEAREIEYLISMAIDPSGSVIVDCSETAAVMGVGMPFRCEAVDATGVSALVNGEITADGEVWFSYGILQPESELHGTGNGIVVAQEKTAGSIGDERLPWQSQIEDGLATWGGYHGPGGVDCSDAAGVIDHSSTFDCYAWKSVDEVVRLNVTITEIGNIEYTEFPIEATDLPESSQTA